jgi:hypothetical protein
MSRSLVGRESEFDALRGHLAAATGQMILVSGEAGVGKTTLVEHALAETITATGRADEWAPTAYGILARAMRPLTEHAPGVLAQIAPGLGAPPELGPQPEPSPPRAEPSPSPSPALRRLPPPSAR